MLQFNRGFLFHISLSINVLLVVFIIVRYDAYEFHSNNDAKPLAVTEQVGGFCVTP